MARSPEEIRKSLKTSIEAKDRTIDIDSGPINDTVIFPIPEELSTSENEALRLSRLHSPFFAQIAKPEEVDTLRVSMRMPAGTGERSRGTQLFWTNEFPEEGIIIPEGTLVATKDGKYTFQTTEERVVPYDSKDSYYNNESFRYEFMVPIMAISSGIEYNIPLGRINLLVTDLEGIGGTINYSKTTGGSTKENQEKTAQRIQKRFLGLDSLTENGLDITYIRDFYPSLIVDVAMIKPKDPLFKRPTRRTAIDIYISGEDLQPHNQTYILTKEDENNLLNDKILKIVLEDQPVERIESIYLEGIPGQATTSLTLGTGIFQYIFVKDEGIYFDSTKAQDQVWIKSGDTDPTKLREGQKLTINYVCNDLVINLQENNFNNITTLFDTDILVRKAIKDQIVIEVLAKLFTDPSDERSQIIKADLENTIILYIENGIFGRTLNPEIFRQDIKRLVPSTIDVYITTFRKKRGSFKQIETVEFNRNVIPEIYEEDDIPFKVSLVK